MNIADLKKILEEEGFNPRRYSLDDERKDEALALRRSDEQWCVYYSERGLETGRKCFESEVSACEYFLAKMRDDPTTRIGWRSGFSM